LVTRNGTSPRNRISHRSSTYVQPTDGERNPMFEITHRNLTAQPFGDRVALTVYAPSDDVLVATRALRDYGIDVLGFVLTDGGVFDNGSGVVRISQLFEPTEA